MYMKFILAEDKKAGERALAARLIDALSMGPVLWLVPGGSNIPISVDVMQSLPEKLQTNLVIALTDERYGAPNHPDSNWLQLTEAGFKPGRAAVITPLSSDPLPLAQAIARYEKNLAQAFQKAGVIIGQFGIGADGHIAGILPGSSAVKDTNLVASYEAPDFTRITLTPTALAHLQAAYVFAYGEAKEPALSQLRDENLSITEQPSQILKQLPEVYIYNDQLED
jgi:6-phosphogluconolactonase/glucosamine-6-phosphate isomerase/deaminase